MFSKERKFSNFSTLIGENTVLVAETLKGEGSVRIDGKYEGEVLLDSDLVIGEKGVVEGSIRAENIEVGGMVIGNIVAKDLVHLTSNSTIKGNVTCNTLIIDHGATISGYCKSGETSDSTSNYNTLDNKFEANAEI